MDHTAIFGPLRARLHCLKIGLVNNDYFDDPIKPIEEKIFSDLHPEVLTILEDCIDDIEKIEKLIPSFKNNVVVEPPIFSNNDGEHQKAKREERVQAILNELATYKWKLNQYQITFNEKLEIKDNYSNEQEQIHVNLSVIQLGALFRILRELGFVEKKVLGRLLSKYFKTTKSTGSEKSMNNALGKVLENDEGLKFWKDNLGEIEKIMRRLLA